MTKQRQIIKKIIMTSPKHLTAEEIFLQAKKQMPKIAFGTVYRNLGLLVSDNEIRKVDVVGSSTHYDKTTIPHEHLLCCCCGDVIDIKELDLSKEIEKLKSTYNIIGYDFIVKHICKKCESDGR